MLNSGISEKENTRVSLNGQSIALVSTVPFFLVNQLSSYIENLKSMGVKITLITSEGEELEPFINDENIQVVIIEIARKISVWKDIKALFRLFYLFRRDRFSIVHSTTPKAGLLCSIAAKIANIPVRLHTFTGQVWATKQGWMRWVLQSMDKMILRLNTHCYADSPSQKDFLIESGVASDSGLSIYGKGSLAGVDMKRFSLDHFPVETRKSLKKHLGIHQDSFVITFIGRLTREKGIDELLHAFEGLKKESQDAVLLLLGPLDEGESKTILKRIESVSGAYALGYINEPEQYLAITDVLCLPSYREGFGTVVIEAAAMGVPTVATHIPGLVDAVDDGRTGILVVPHNSEVLKVALQELMQDSNLLAQMSLAAKQRCKKYFDSVKVNDMLAKEYVRWLEMTE